MASKTFDRYVAIVLIIVGTFFVISSTKISVNTYGSSVGPNIMPMLLGILLILLSLLLFFQTMKYKSNSQKEEKQDYGKFLMMVGLTLLYALTFEWLGYIISTFLFLVIGFQLMKKEKLLFSIIISFLFTFIVYYVYVKFLQGTLPGFPEWILF